MTGVRLPVLAVLTLACAALACSAGDGPLPGFTAAYMAASADGGAPAAFHSVRGSSPGAAWAVGEGGMAVELAGSVWNPAATGSTATLGGLSMVTFDAALAVELGGARVLGWDGRAWAPLGADRADRAAAATFGFSPQDAWVAGDGVEHFDGTSWTQEVASGARFTSIFGSFRTDVWAVGLGGVQHYDGTRWSPVTPPAGTPPLAAVWASQLWDAWFVGAQGTILHWNGSTLMPFPSVTTVDLTCVTGTSASDVWAGGKDGTLLNWDGNQWNVYTSPAGHTITDVWRPFDDDVYFVDDTGAVTRFVL